MSENLHDSTMETTEKKSNRRLNVALIRAIAAILIAGILLTITGFAVIDLLKGPKAITAIQDEEEGAFVSGKIFNILGFYADDVKNEKVTGRYALTNMGTKLVSVYFTQRYLESADTICDETYDLLSGKTSVLDHYVNVQGTVAMLSEDSSSLMYDWFGMNKAQLVEMGVVAETDDYADHLADQVLIVDTVNGRDQTLVIVVSSIAAALLLYMLVELALMGFGFYSVKPKKEEEAEKDDEVEFDKDLEEDAALEPTLEDEEPTPEPVQEDEEPTSEPVQEDEADSEPVQEEPVSPDEEVKTEDKE